MRPAQEHISRVRVGDIVQQLNGTRSPKTPIVLVVSRDPSGIECLGPDSKEDVPVIVRYDGGLFRRFNKRVQVQPGDGTTLPHPTSTESSLRTLPLLFLVLSACFIDTAAQVADRVTDPDKIIHDYEWFHTAGQRIGAKQAQVSASKELLADDSVTPTERARMRIDLTGQQQSCRELVADYNANGQKVTVNIWKGWSLPNSIDPSECE